MATRDRKMQEHDFPKNRSLFLEIHRTSDAHMGTLAQSHRANGLYKKVFTRAVFDWSKRALGWQLGTANFRDHNLPKKTSWLFGNHQTSDNHMCTVAP